jgi:hypothetical protein
MSHPATDAIIARVEARLTREQGKCPNNSMGSTDRQHSIEKFGHPRRSAAKCGRVALLRRRSDGATIAARLFCDRKTCPDCGPHRRARLAGHYTAAIGTTPVVRFQVDRPVWATTARKLARRGASYLRIPAPGGQYTVFATSGEGEPVSDLAAALEAAFAAVPLADDHGRPDTARVSSSRCWAERSTPAAAGRGAGEDEQGGWELLGLAGVTIDQVVEAAKDQDLYLGALPVRDLAPAWAEAHLIRVPDPGTVDYRRFAWRVRLHWPARPGRDEVRAA